MNNIPEYIWSPAFKRTLYRKKEKRVKKIENKLVNKISLDCILWNLLRVFFYSWKPVSIYLVN